MSSDLGLTIHHGDLRGHVKVDWLQVVSGVAILNGIELNAGDGVQIESGGHLTIDTQVGTEVLLFDLM